MSSADPTSRRERQVDLGVLLDSLRLCFQLNVNAKLATFGHDLIHQIGVKLRQGTRAALHNRHLRSDTHGHMSKFEGYVPAADKQDSAGKIIKLQELLSGDYSVDCLDAAASNDHSSSLCNAPPQEDCLRPTLFGLSIAAGVRVR
jgi:hypothetical protein